MIRVTLGTLGAALLATASLLGNPFVPGALDDPAASRPAPEPRTFAPGVRIDWAAREVLVDTHVVLRDGPLEFFACFAGKEHESILRFDASATHIYMALGLIGLEPGHPPRWDSQARRFRDPAGDLVDLEVRWEENGRTTIADAYAWLREVEYARTPLARPWIFAGSRRLPDNTLSADESGVGIALVDFDDSLLCYSRRYPSRYGALWAETNPAAIPPRDTPVTLALRAARRQPLDARLDARGTAWVRGRYCTWEDLADLLRLASREDGSSTIKVDAATLRTDVAALHRFLERRGVPDGAYSLVHTPTTVPRDEADR